MNRLVNDTDGDILNGNQLTLYARTKNGNRPSYIRAAQLEPAIPVCEMLLTKLAAQSRKPIRSGRFAAHNQLARVNDSPATILIDTKPREQYGRFRAAESRACRTPSNIRL